MRVRLDYGRTGLEVELPANCSARVFDLPAVEPLPDPDSTIEACLMEPIGTPSLVQLARGKKSVCILVCDVTRPVPNERLLTPMLRMIEEAGVRREDVLILVATGLHRPNEGEELVEILGERIAGTYRVENHDGKDLGAHEYLGLSPHGVPIYIDRRYVEADLKIATGLIEPHLMAGFSGGRKLICPGIAGLTTVRAWHSPRFLEHPLAVCGVLEGNPVHQENTWIAQKAGCDFIVNVTIDGARRITSVVAGDMIEAFEEGVRNCRRQVTVPTPTPFDVVVTSSAGYPLDATFYQSVKGMTGALPIVKEGGTIILAARISEGIGSQEFQGLLRETNSLEEFSEKILDPNYFIMDQWQLEELAKVRRRCKVKLYTEGLPAETLGKFFVEPVASMEQAVSDSLREYGADAEVAVIPKGPYVLPAVV